MLPADVNHYLFEIARVLKAIGYGSWCGRSDYLSFQDICIARQREAMTFQGTA
jgi:hypothetical protein